MCKHTVCIVHYCDYVQALFWSVHHFASDKYMSEHSPKSSVLLRIQMMVTPEKDPRIITMMHNADICLNIVQD
jgi:hypothetical protein